MGIGFAHRRLKLPQDTSSHGFALYPYITKALTLVATQKI